MRWRRAALSVKHRYYIASLILYASIAEITAQHSYCLCLCVFDRIRQRLDYYPIIRQINILEGRVSVIISYSSRCLITETVKYFNENSFIENFAVSKQYVGTERETNAIINNIGYVHFACSEEDLPCPAKI